MVTVFHVVMKTGEGNLNKRVLKTCADERMANQERLTISKSLGIPGENLRIEKEFEFKGEVHLWFGVPLFQ